MTLSPMENLNNEFDNALANVPAFILDCPVYYQWVEYKGRPYFAILNYEASVARGKPMIDLCYCATKAMNGHVLFTAPYVANLFNPNPEKFR